MSSDSITTLYDFKSLICAGNYYAINDTCSHAGGSLSEGKLDGCTITCDWHGAQFECSSGKLIKFPGEIDDLRSYDVVIESDNIFVET